LLVVLAGDSITGRQRDNRSTVAKCREWQNPRNAAEKEPLNGFPEEERNGAGWKIDG